MLQMEYEWNVLTWVILWHCPYKEMSKAEMELARRRVQDGELNRCV